FPAMSCWRSQTRLKTMLRALCRELIRSSPKQAPAWRRESSFMSQKHVRQFLGQVTVSAKLFAKYQALIHAKTGIWLASSKTALLCGRLSRRLRVLQLETLDESYDVGTR